MWGRTTLKLALVGWLGLAGLSWADDVLVGPMPGPMPGPLDGPLPSPCLQPLLPGVAIGSAGCCRPAPLPLLPPPPLALPPMDPPTPVVTLRVRVPACSAPGEDIEYHICLENCTPGDAHHVIVRNPLPANAKFVRANPEPTQAKPELLWKLGTMHGGERRKIVLVLAPTNMDDVTSCARVQFEHGQCVTTRLARGLPGGPGGPGMPGVDGTGEPPTAGGGKLKLTMTGPTETYNPKAEYFLTVANTGTAAAVNVLVAAQIPKEMAFQNASADGKFLEGQVAWVLGQLEAGERRTVSVSLHARMKGKFCVRGRALADRGLTDVAEVCTTFRGASTLHPELQVKKNPLAVGEQGSYVIKFVNQSTESITNLRVKAKLPDALAFVEAKGADVKVGDQNPDGSHTLSFEVKSLAPNTTLEVEIVAKALKAGEARVGYEASADQLAEGGPVVQQDSIVIFADPPRKE